jgi:hypothetical protein
MEKEIKIVPPEGYEIDRENSTLECIKFKEKKTKNRLEAAVDLFGRKVYFKYEVEIENGFIKVPLPNANTEWTLAAFHWAEKFCKEYPTCYPKHHSEYSYNFLYICCDNLK